MRAAALFQSLTRRDSSVLPASLQGVIPSCAQDCVATYIEASFIPSACSNSTDVSVSCLCSHYSSSGFTLGEVSLACLNANCPQSILDEGAQVYRICSNISAAVSATHKILTLTTFPTKTTIVVSETQTSTSTFSSPSTTLFSQTEAASSSAQPSSTSLPQTATSTTANQVSLASSSSSPTLVTMKSTLTTGQAAGLSVGAIAVLGLFVGAIFICVRRKRKTAQKLDDERHSYDFVDRSPILRRTRQDELEQAKVVPPHSFAQNGASTPEQPMSESRNSYAFALHAAGGSAPKKPTVKADVSLRRFAQNGASTPEQSMSEPRNSYAFALHAAGGSAPKKPTVKADSPRDRFAQNGAPTPEQPTSEPRNSYAFALHAASSSASKKPTVKSDAPPPIRPIRRMSQPRNSYAFALYAAQDPGSNRRTLKSDAPAFRRSSRPTRPESAATVQTIFEEDSGSRDSKSLPALPASPRMPPRIITTAASRSSRANPEITSAEDIGNRGLFIKIPGKSPTSLSPNSAKTPISKPVRVSLPPSSAMSYSYLPSYYMSNDSRTPTMPDHSNQPRLALHNVSRAVRQSFASDTSFESVDPDEITPPEDEDKQLSPVCESPISGLRYPKIPRSANQAVPRVLSQSSPSQAYALHIPASKQPTLLPKRRGNDASNNSEHSFYVDDSPYEDKLVTRRPSRKERAAQDARGDSPTLTGYGTAVRSGSKRNQNAAADPNAPRTPKSPWELTPSRRGEDLYISVE